MIHEREKVLYGKKKLSIIVSARTRNSGDENRGGKLWANVKCACMKEIGGKREKIIL